ncbi:MAG: hypothetical protein A2086_16180 [Spirochaetes bacterium GWD1_27_9]|nr:MAG: hypothetical protein A2Z98_13620 [Spirochaetes bacterium GWB1_27_13]OHD27601.1 MAG: hypothetical protein A2Y34_18240 [Spirochaetes bacterium GWC1_27_15]OHD38266.1 MAG: hypothetical protein A2086_16180 [Spirochaetes bacterium GWD1_27_9]
MSDYFPLNIDLTNKLCIIVGGGGVALRKLETLLGYKPRIKIITKKILSYEIFKIAKKNNIEISKNKLKLKYLKKAFLVVLATNNKKLNKKIAKVLIKKNILVNNATGKSNIIFPAIYKKDDLVISVSTSGISPSFSAKIRDKISEEIPETYFIKLHLLKIYRSKAKIVIKDKIKRKEFLKRIANLEISKLNEVDNIFAEYK